MIVNNTLPLVSVLIPVYNGTTFLDEAINSVLNNKYPKVEIILVDDGSTDASREKCRQYQKRHSCIRFYGFTKNSGMTRCLNFGIKKAKGTYIARLNQDDIMMPERLHQQVSYLESHPDHVVVGGNIELFTSKTDPLTHITFPVSDEKIRQQWLYLSPFSDPTVMYRKDAWLKTEGYSQYFWPADDVHMWYQLGSIGKMANLPEIVTKVRWHDSAGSIRSHRRQMIKTFQVHQWAAEFIASPTLQQRLFWIAQLLAGYCFSPKFNWFIYRSLKHLQVLKFSFPWRMIRLSLAKSIVSA